MHIIDLPNNKDIEQDQHTNYYRLIKNFKFLKIDKEQLIYVPLLEVGLKWHPKNYQSQELSFFNQIKYVITTFNFNRYTINGTNLR